MNVAMPNQSSGSDTFRAPWGATLKLTSLCVTLLLIAIPVGALMFERMPPAARFAVVVLPLAMLGICSLFVVRSYSIAGENLLIRRLLWNTAISLAGLTSAAVVPNPLAKSIRLFGNGGLYSFTGLYWSQKLGRFRAFVNDLAKGVVLQARGRTFVISPDNPQGFVAAVSRRFSLTPDSAVTAG